MGPAESLWQVSDAFSLQAVGEAFAYRPVPAGSRPPRPACSRRLLRQPAGLAGCPADLRSAPVQRGGREAAARDPYGTPSLRRRSPRGAARRTGPRSAPSVDAAQAAFDTGSYDLAASIAQAVLEIDGISSAAYLLLGHARLNQGDNAGAVEPLQRAVFLDPLAGHAHFLLAVALSSVGRTKQAAPAYRAAATTLPGVPGGDGAADAGRTSGARTGAVVPPSRR